MNALIKTREIYSRRSLEYANWIPAHPSTPTPTPKKVGILDLILNCIWLLGSSSGDLKSVKYSFIAITPRSTLTKRSSIC